MNALGIAGWTVRVTGIVMLVLGLAIWAGMASGIVAIHMLVGIVLVAALWVAAVLALRAGVKPVLPVVAIAWGAFMAWFGMSQATIMPGDQHILVEVTHLVVGIVAIGLGEALVAAGRRSGAARA